MSFGRLKKKGYDIEEMYKMKLERIDLMVKFI